MTIFAALGFMVLGGVIVEVFEIHAWRRYQQGKTEGRGIAGYSTQNSYSGLKNGR